jgi:hypothetical protein
MSGRQWPHSRLATANQVWDGGSSPAKIYGKDSRKLVAKVTLAAKTAEPSILWAFVA